MVPLCYIHAHFFLPATFWKNNTPSYCQHTIFLCMHTFIQPFLPATFWKKQHTFMAILFFFAYIIHSQMHNFFHPPPSGKNSTPSYCQHTYICTAAPFFWIHIPGQDVLPKVSYRRCIRTSSGYALVLDWISKCIQCRYRYTVHTWHVCMYG